MTNFVKPSREHFVACESKLSHFPELDPARCAKVQALVLTGYGLNCEAETSAAFEMLGSCVTQLHVGEMIASGGARGLAFSPRATTIASRT